MEQQYQLDHSLDQYIQKLVSYGIIFNKKLQPAMFYLKNGLLYPGLLTTSAIEGYEQLVKVPVNLLLTTHHAMKDQQLRQVFANKFYQVGYLQKDMWQDRILVTYLLYLLSKGKDCIWTFMAKQFSKDIDIISFWNQEELDGFIDKSVIKAAKKERNYFEGEWTKFSQIKELYAELSDEQWFNKVNYKWIYIHTISRCFGSFLNCTYFVPFCELFNHHSVDVSYTCVDQNKPINQSTTKVSVYTAQTGEGQSQDSISSSYSQDYLSDDDFDYMSINSYTIKWFSKISYDLKEKQTQKIEKLLKELYEWMDKELEWRGFTFIYLGQIIEKLKILENQYKAGRKKFQATMQKIQETKNHLHAYRKYLVQFYKSLGRQYQKVKNQRGVQTTVPKNSNWSIGEKKKEQTKLTYTHFKMQARDNARFAQNSQIYFCYGKLSNRTLLVRYGFSLESNPYQHVWIKFKMGKQIQPYPDLFELIQNKGLTVNYKVKLKSFTFALEPIIFYRMCEWKLTHHTLEDIFFITDVDKEIKCLNKVKEVYLDYQTLYKQMNGDLTDPKLSYHQYFVRVYNKQKKTIIELQLDLVEYVLDLLLKIKTKQIKSKEIQVKPEYRKHLKHYLKGLRGLMIV